MPSSVPVDLLPPSAPFSPEQRAWLNGFLAGLFSGGPPAELTGAAEAGSALGLVPLTVLFGSQTGTSEALAKRAAKEAGQRGFAATVMDMSATSADRLPREKNLLVITSTFGEGEPPDNAKALHAALTGGNSPRLEGVCFSVCGLGDTHYAQFCRCGKDFDSGLERLGAARAAPRADCDVDYEEKFAAWLDAALAALGAATIEVRSAAAQPSAARVEPPAQAGYSRKNPFPAPVLSVRRLSQAGSSKEVIHAEFSLAESGLTYDAGDSLGVFPHNCPTMVGFILQALGCDGEEAVPGADGAPGSLRRALTEHYDLGRPSGELLARFASEPAPPVHHVIDVLLAHPKVKLAPDDFVRCLRKLQPRLYSIASSPKAHAGAVHLTVAVVRYEAGGRMRQGVCSTFLAERAAAAGRVPVFVHANKLFRPPARPDAPAIMVGPGTGIAPFRAFLAEREATGATGRNWLFFGDREMAADFIYREEIEAWRRAGILTRLDTAFSRDQPEKLYVQHRMLENAAELFAWLEAGGHFYVCGDAGRMAKDVDAALRRVVEIGGGRTAAQAAEYVQGLRTAKRYARDVY